MQTFHKSVGHIYYCMWTKVSVAQFGPLVSMHVEAKKNIESLL